MKIIFMGTPDFAVEPLKAIAAAGHDIVCVVTQPDKPKNRGKKMQPTPVKAAAELLGITVIQPEKVKNNEEFLEYIKSLDADIAVVAAYGQILPVEVLETPKYGSINIHASLLPKLRGAAPIQRAILEGYLFSGVTIMKMEAGLDTGDMITKKLVEITGMNSEELHDELMYMGAELVVELLKKVEAEGADALKGEKQDDSKATYAKMIRKEEGLLNFNCPANDVALRMNAMTPWPSAYTYYKGSQIKLRDPEWYGSAREYREPGTILEVSKDGVVIQCKGDLLRIHSIQIPGKKFMNIREFIKGNTLEEGVVLGTEE